MSNFWISWYQPTEDYRPLKDPSKAKAWWCTGRRSSDYAATICAWVKANTEIEAKKIVQEDWPEAQEWRFIEKKPDDWEGPPKDRFPPRGRKK